MLYHLHVVQTLVRVGRCDVTKLLKSAVHWIEHVVAALLVIIATLGAIDLVVEIVEGVRGVGYLPPDRILRVLDSVLVVFVVIELFAIAVAYIERRNIIGTVMEAGLIAVVRKLIVFEASGDPVYLLYKSIGLGVLILAIGGTWYVLRSSGVCELGGAHER